MLATRARMAAGGSDPNAIVGTLVGPTTITTSTSSTATAYSNQRKVDRCQNGVLWSMFWDGTSTTTTSMDFYYSTDNGATWTKGGEFGFAGTSVSYTPNASFFIDLDDYAHVVYKDRSNGYIYYRRGTPNAGRTAWTWSSAVTVNTNINMDYPDIVAHREGTGWVAHIVASPASSGGTKAAYWRVTITSGGSVSVGSATDLVVGGGGVNGYPSIDFHHTGDGKTIKDAAPHLFVACSKGSSGAGEGIRFKKATYSGGTWTWGTEREIDSTRYSDVAARWLVSFFDGTRAIIVGVLYDGANTDFVLYERDAADTTTTTRVLADNEATSTYHVWGSATYDGDGNVYVFGRNADEAAGSRDLTYRKWTRATTTLGSEVVIDSAVGDPSVSAKRGYSNNRIEWIYTDGTASPYNVNFGSLR